MNPGDIVTIGLGSHDMETEAWLVFPEKGVTHLEDPRNSPTCMHWKMKTDKRYCEKLLVPSVRRSKILTGKLLEIRQDGWGGEMALIDLGGRERWFNTFLLNCKPLSGKSV